MVKHFEETELEILLKSVENITVTNKLRLYASIHMENIISIVELFLKTIKYYAMEALL